MAMRQTRPPHSLHRRATANMGLPPNGTRNGHVDHRSLPTLVEDPVPNPGLLRA